MMFMGGAKTLYLEFVKSIYERRYIASYFCLSC
jgi:hypothetical protein